MNKAKYAALFIAELHNKKIDAIKAGLSPIEYLKTTRVYVEDNNGHPWHANEWHIAQELEKYYKNEIK
jgi:hypothetical protein